MDKLYILKKEDFEGELFENLSEIENGIILYIYGNKKNISVGQRQKIKEISEITKVDFKHFSNDGLSTIVNDLFEKYKEILIGNEFLFIGEKSKLDLEELINKKLKSLEKIPKNNKKNQYPSVYGSIECKTIQKEETKDVSKSKDIKQVPDKKSESQKKIIEKKQDHKCKSEEDNNNAQQNDNTKEHKESKQLDDNSKHLQKKVIKDKETTQPKSNNKVDQKTKKKSINLESNESDDITYEFDSESMGQVIEKKLFPPVRRRNTTNADYKDSHTKKELTKDELESNIQERKALEKEIFGTDPTIAPKEEVIDIGLEIRVEFLTSRLRYLKEEIEKILKRCKVTDYPVSNDIAFKWIINVLQTNSLEEFNNQNRIDINLNEQEYEKICKLANNYNQLCSDIYEEDDW